MGAAWDPGRRQGQGQRHPRLLRRGEHGSGRYRRRQCRSSPTRNHAGRNRQDGHCERSKRWGRVHFYSVYLLDVLGQLAALPKADLFIALHDLLTTYPSPQSLKLSLLDYLHAVLVDVLPGDPRAIKLTATRFITPELDIQSPDFVDVFRNANEKLMQGVREAWEDDKPAQKDSDRLKRKEEMAMVYAQFVDEWAEKEDVDLNLVSPKQPFLSHHPSPIQPSPLFNSPAVDSHFILHRIESVPRHIPAWPHPEMLVSEVITATMCTSSCDPYLVDGQVIGPGCRLVAGVAPESIYVSEEVYWLTWCGRLCECLAGEVGC